MFGIDKIADKLVGFGIDFVKARILNKKTSIGAVLIGGSLIGLGKLDAATGLHLITLISNSGMTLTDFLMYFGFTGILFVGIYFVFAKIKLATNIDYIKHKDNNAIERFKAGMKYVMINNWVKK